jgi:hypothetical protein
VRQSSACVIIDADTRTKVTYYLVRPAERQNGSTHVEEKEQGS